MLNPLTWSVTFNGYEAAFVALTEINTGADQETWLWLESDGSKAYCFSIQPQGLYG